MLRHRGDMAHCVSVRVEAKKDSWLNEHITKGYFPNSFVDADTNSQCGTPYGHRAADMYVNADGRKVAADFGIDIRVGTPYDGFLAEVRKALQVKRELQVKWELQLRRELPRKRDLRVKRELQMKLEL